MKYTDAGSVELRLMAAASSGGLRVEIADTGRGIPEASRDRLFQDFERLEAATSVEGTGLGLAIAARVVKLMGGTINYSPNPDGTKANEARGNNGSVFWFELPTSNLASSLQSGPVKGASTSTGQRVLLVDDMKVNRDIIGAFLTAAGHAVTLTDNGQDSIRLAGEQPFDLILMDVRMPEMDGHITKPVDHETLISAIDDAIARIPSGIRSTAAAPNKAEQQPTPQSSSSPDRSDARASA